MIQYLIWQSASLGWIISREDGKSDVNCQAGTLAALQEYCDDNKLDYTVYPLENIITPKSEDTFEFVKTT